MHRYRRIVVSQEKKVKMWNRSLDRNISRWVYPRTTNGIRMVRYKAIHLPKLKRRKYPFHKYGFVASYVPKKVYARVKPLNDKYVSNTYNQIEDPVNEIINTTIQLLYEGAMSDLRS